MRSFDRVGLVFLLLLALGCATPAQTPESSQSAKAQKQQFDELQAHAPDEIFAPTIGPKVKACLKAYAAHESLPNGLHYGDSVREYSLEGKTLALIQGDMQKLHCAFKPDVLKDPVKHEPQLYHGKPVPLWVFLCPDGGVVRVKPEGDPLSRYRPQVHGSKALRYPYDSKFENFDDEIVKVDNDGNPLPKSRADLKPQYLLQGWADDAHTDFPSR